MDIASIRKDYKLKSLSENEVDASPIEQFASWFKEAISAKVEEVNAMLLGTSTLQGKPSSRVVLLKDFDHRGLVFFTNYESKKGKELSENPAACLTFFWPQLERQIRIEGLVEKVSESESDEYFFSRPWESRVGAWVSAQSNKIESRDELEKTYEVLAQDFREKGMVPRPSHWGGFRLKPEFFEFWQGRPSRLHDRICYIPKGAAWEIYRLAP